VFKNAENVPMRIAAVAHRQMERDEKEIGLVELKLEINPFTPKLASDMHDDVRRMLFTANEAEVRSLLGGASYYLPIGPQEVIMRMAPDQGKPTLSIDEAKIGQLHMRRSKKATTWRCVFTLTFHPQSKDQLAQAVDAYLKTRYVTMADAQPDLFAEAEKRSRAGRSAGVADASAAAAH